MRRLSRSLEIIREDGLREYASAIKRHILWRPMGHRIRWNMKHLRSFRKRIVMDINGYRMIIDISKAGIHRRLFINSCHEPNCTRIFKGMIPAGAVVVDVGANIGYYALLEAGIARKVYAIEPEPGNLNLLRENVELNSLGDRVEIMQMAVSNTSGRALLTLSSQPNQHRLCPQFRNRAGKSIEVSTVSLDEFLENREADVIRMDLEGAEWLVIEGMKNILRGNRPLILFIEIHPEHIRDYGGDAPAMLRRLIDNGFRLRYLVASSGPGVTFSRSMKAADRLLRPEHGFEYEITDEDPFLNEETRRVLEGTLCYRVFMERVSVEQQG